MRRHHRFEWKVARGKDGGFALGLGRGRVANFWGRRFAVVSHAVVLGSEKGRYMV